MLIQYYGGGMKNIVLLFFSVSLIACTAPSRDISQNEGYYSREIAHRHSEEVSKIVQSLDITEIDNYIDIAIQNDRVLQESIDSLGTMTTLSGLYLIDIYGYFRDGQWYLISDDILGIFNIEYFLTIEIGAGAYPMANYNNITVGRLFNRSIVRNDKIIGTIRVWDVREGLPGGHFVFAVLDKDMNIFYKYLSNTEKE